MYIEGSVGFGGKNKKSDVQFVQDLLALLSEQDLRMPEIGVDGVSGPMTIDAVSKFQTFYVKLKKPDGRIDPNGRSEKVLVAKAIEIDKDLIPVLAKKYGLRRESPAKSGAGARSIQYRSSAKRVLSPYSENVVKLAMGFGGILKCDISSTIRTMHDQARIMYDNCASFPAATSVSSLRAARGWGYAAAGRSVEEVYFENKSKARADVISLMEKKIASISKGGVRVSLHCVPEADYKKNNILDIPYSSVEATKRKDFEIALMGMSTEVKNMRYKQPTKAEEYISRLIIEDRCWHLEIPQLNKALPNAKVPSAPVVNYGNRPGLVFRGVVADVWSGEYFGKFLDDWF
ncbi:peptidoglycan-binding domain-containing protein [Microbulbifer aggregans]|uniref:peptidoglycan-binding domain-containing protein n=1 Tax=Microbulbifer aggregans TaxID=1769779 RepID=UPI001CFC548A|nr:peptidoglycan-binding protein [Microbulbifer aggregans]